MRVRWIAWVIVAGCLTLMVLIFGSIKSELAPLEDRSQFRLQVTAPEGTSFDYMDQYIDRLAQFVMDSVPEAKTVLTVTAPGFSGSGATNTGFVRATLTEPSERNRSQQQIVDMINRNLGKFSDGKAFAIQEQTISVNRRAGLPVQFVIQNNDFNKLAEVLPKILEQANKNPAFQGVDVDLKFNKPEVNLQIDRIKAAQLGVSVADVSGTLQLALSNLQLGYFYRTGKQYSVIGQVARNDRDDPTDLKNIYVRNNRGELISLDNLVSMQEQTTPPTLYHFNRYKSATISAGVAPGHTLGEGIKAMEDITRPLLDGTFSTSLAGASRDFAESSGNIMFALGLAILLIFLVLAAQFESFIDPIIIIITVPLAFAGALLSLWLFDQTFNIFSQIGMIMLVGLVTKNGILIVEFANQKQHAGMSKRDAVIEAASARLRPILMTSLAMALGALPIALSLGAASTSRIPLGIVIVGGIMFSLILTLYVVPAVYSFLSQPKHKSEMELMDEKEVSRA
jgi:multidrug efflux pump